MSKDHFSAVADAYARHRPTYPSALFDYLAQISLNQAVWDCGTGNGQAALGLAAHFHQVWASDLSFEQLRRAPVQPNVAYFCCKAEASPLPPASVDLVTVGQAWHWFDGPAFEAECQRVLRPHGHVAIWGYNLIRIDKPIDQLIDHFYHQIVGPYWPAERRILEQGYADFPQSFRAEPTPSFAMKLAWDLAHLMGYLASWSATQAFRDKTGTDPLPDLQRNLEKLWGPADLEREVRWPLILKVARKI